MNFRELKEFCNSLPENELDKKIILWREDEAITDISAEQLDEDQYIEIDNSENGCFPVSECKDLDPEIKIRKVYDKGTPILHEVF